MPNYVPKKLKDFYNPSHQNHNMSRTKHHHVFPIHKNLYLSRIHPSCQKNSQKYITDRMIFIILWTGDQPICNKNPQHICDAKISTDKNADQDVKNFLGYCATHPDSKIRFFASKMILQVHSDTSNMDETKARSTASEHYFRGNSKKSGKSISLNRSIHILCIIIGVAAWTGKPLLKNTGEINFTNSSSITRAYTTSYAYPYWQY